MLKLKRFPYYCDRTTGTPEQRVLERQSAFPEPVLAKQILDAILDVRTSERNLVRIIREGAESGVWGDEIAPKMIVAA
jgi:hypothetical protein